ncbi:FG-GAP-like repeat-containing protein [Tardiphaga sp. 619_E2_N8_5]|uniref:FG-GAP-like repeat-containing protein n=1 Tax=unclassified Tardiphaga TaxID=2631404 RepID=UPI003F1EBFCA
MIKDTNGFLFPEVTSIPYRFEASGASSYIARDGHGAQLIFGGTPETISLLPNGKIKELLLRQQVNRWGETQTYTWSNTRISKITWGTGAFKYEAFFDWTTLSYSWPSYSTGNANDAVIGAIRVVSPSGAVKRYEFTYAPSPQTTWPRLQSVTERSEQDQTATRIIAKFRFDSEIPNRFKEIQSEQLTSGNASEGRLRFARSASTGSSTPLLITDDGRILTLVKSGAQFSWLDHGSFGTGAISRYRVLDIDGDGRDDVVFINANQQIVSRAIVKDGSLGPEKPFGRIAFAPYREDIDPKHYRDVVFQEGRYSFADLTGDGIPEVIFTDHHGVVKSGALKTGDLEIAFTTPVQFGEGEQLDKYLFADFNGDGVPDLLLVTRDGRVLCGFTVAGALTSPVQVAAGVPMSEPFRLIAGDANADGLPDLFFSSANTMTQLRNRGAAGLPELLTVSAPEMTAGNKNSTSVELNGDGISDFMVVADSSTKLFSMDAGKYASRNVVFEASAEFLGYPAKQRMVQWFLADLNGDDRPDLIAIDVSNKLRVLLAQENDHSVLSDGILKSITNEFGGVTDIRYASSSEFPHTDMPSVIPVVRLVSTSNGPSKFETEYHYEGGIVGVLARDFRGFAKVTSTQKLDGAPLQTTAITFLQGDTPSGSPDIKSATARFAGLPIAREVQGSADYSVRQAMQYRPMPAQGPYLRLLSELTVDRCDIATPVNCSTSRTESQHDEFGNYLKDITHDGATIVQTRTREYAPNVAAWIVDIITNDRTVDGVTSALLARTEYRYSGADTKCSQLIPGVSSPPPNAPSGVLRYRSPTDALLVTQAYDASGNTICTRVGNFWETAKTDASRSVVLQKINSLSHQESFEFYGLQKAAPAGLHGKLFAQVDLNRIRTEFSYDEFRRLTQHSRADCRIDQPNCVAKKIQYPKWGTPGAQTARLDAENGQFLEANYDGNGRVTSVRRTGIDTRAIVQERFYDGKGRLTKVNLPHFEGDLTSGMFDLTYDAFDNVTTVKFPDGTETTVCYRASTKTQIDQFGRQTREAFDSSGRVIRRDLINATGYQCPPDSATSRATFSFKYDGVGRLLSYVNPSQRSASRNYDMLGNMIESTEPDSGRVNFRYGGDRGLLLSRTTENGAKVEYAYDDLGRTVSEVITPTDAPATRHTYRYDATARLAVGKLYQLEGPDSLETTTYDKMGLPKREQFKSGDFEFIADYSRDQSGRLLSTQYSDAKSIERRYSGRYLSQIYSGAGLQRVGASIDTFTPLGDPRSISYSNGTTELRKYGALDADCALLSDYAEL